MGSSDVPLAHQSSAISHRADSEREGGKPRNAASGNGVGDLAKGQALRPGTYLSIRSNSASLPA